MSEKDNSVPPLSFESERQARIKRSLVIQSCVRGTMRAFAKRFRTFVLRSTQLARGLAARRHIYSDIREFQQFDDRMLADIGVTIDRGRSVRGQIAAVNAQIPRDMGHWGFVSSARFLAVGSEISRLPIVGRGLGGGGGITGNSEDQPHAKAAA